MTGKFKPAVPLALALILNAAPALAEVTVGLTAVWQSSPYKGHEDTVMPAPFVHVEGERFYLRGPDAGVNLWKDENQALSFGLALSGFLSFDADDTDDRQLKELSDRRSTVNAYLQYGLKGDYGHAGARLMRDVLGHSDAFSAEAFYLYPVTLGPVRVSPGAGLRWDSGDQLEYYSGVSPAEARRSGLDQYRPDDGISPFLLLEADWQFSEHWRLTAAGRTMFLSREIKDSPMVDEGRVFTLTSGLLYTF